MILQYASSRNITYVYNVFSILWFMHIRSYKRIIVNWTAQLRDPSQALLYNQTMPGLSFLGKKSWHTSNIDNVEKVWLAEKKADEVRFSTIFVLLFFLI